MAKSSYTRLEDYEGSREDIAAVDAPVRDLHHATKVDPVTGKMVTDRVAEAAAVDDIVAKAQAYVEETGEATPRAVGETVDDPDSKVFRSDEETDEAFMSDEYDRAKAYEEGRVDPIEGLIALEESGDPLLQDHDAKRGVTRTRSGLSRRPGPVTGTGGMNASTRTASVSPR